MKNTQTAPKPSPTRDPERRDKLEHALDAIARDARVRPEEYLRDSRVPEGGE